MSNTIFETMINKIEHLGFAVQDAAEAIPVFNKLFGTEPYKVETVESENVKTIFYQVGPNKIELLESTDPEGVIAKFIAKKGQAMHHVALDVSNIEEEMNRLKKEGFKFINETPKQGADNKIIAFLHPATTNGILIELCQEKI
jgi:methylmalonyl-CoA/ethylmalonyl-CoA epimerase